MSIPRKSLKFYFFLSLAVAIFIMFSLFCVYLYTHSVMYYRNGDDLKEYLKICDKKDSVGDVLTNDVEKRKEYCRSVVYSSVKEGKDPKEFSAIVFLPCKGMEIRKMFKFVCEKNLKIGVVYEILMNGCNELFGGIKELNIYLPDGRTYPNGVNVCQDVCIGDVAPSDDFLFVSYYCEKS